MRNDQFLRVAGAALVAVSLVGCGGGPLRADFGRVTEVNRAAQIVNPEAGKPADSSAPAVINTVDGQKVEKAMERYRADRPDASRGKLLSELGN